MEIFLGQKEKIIVPEMWLLVDWLQMRRPRTPREQDLRKSEGPGPHASVNASSVSCAASRPRITNCPAHPPSIAASRLATLPNATTAALTSGRIMMRETMRFQYIASGMLALWTVAIAPAQILPQPDPPFQGKVDISPAKS